ncbi:MAG: DUF6065 family protein [Amphiplicatus sp.]
MKLIAYLEAGASPNIRPAQAERDWMDATPERFAYRCLPLNIANTHGWEALAPARIRARWIGGPAKEALAIETDAPAHQRPVSHFGSGVLTFHLGCLIRTEPGIELWATGSPNHSKHGIAPLSGVVETDWSPYSFTMNWRFTAPGEVVFEKDEPFCFFFPLSRRVLAETAPEFRRLSDEPALEADFKAWTEGRATFNKDLTVAGSAARSEGWQRDYFHGRAPSGAVAAEHRTKLRLKPFKPID